MLSNDDDDDDEVLKQLLVVIINCKKPLKLFSNYQCQRFTQQT